MGSNRGRMPKMQRRSRAGTPLSIDSGGGSFIEERGKTFVVRESADVDGAAGPSIEQNFDKMNDFVSRSFDRKEKQIKSDMRDEFETRLAKDRREQDETWKALKNELSNLTKLTEECNNLKEMQKSLKKDLSEQNNMVLALKRENHGLKSKTPNTETITNENRKLKQENEELKKMNMKLECHLSKLKSVISDKEREIDSMKTLIDSQYKKLKLDLTNTRDKFHTDQVMLHSDMRKQQLMLTEISEVVKTMSHSSDAGVHAVTGVHAITHGETNKSGQRKGRPHTETLRVKSLTLDGKLEADQAKQKHLPSVKVHGVGIKKRQGPTSR